MRDINRLLNTRVKTIPDNEYASAYEVKLDFSLNINPLGTSKTYKEVDLGKILVDYYPENTELLELLAKKHSVPKESIVLSDGCDGGLQLVTQTFLQENDSVIIPTPTFHRYEFHSEVQGANSSFVNTINPTLDLIKQSEKFDTAKIIFLCTPNNPTGIEIPEEEVDKICEAFEGIVVVDEALSTAKSVDKLINKHKNIIIVRSFSKIYGLAALRIGYILTNEKIAKYIKKVSSPFKVNGVAQEIAKHALIDQDFVDMTNGFLKDELLKMKDFFDSLSISHTISNTTNFIINTSKISDNSIEAHKIFLKSGIATTCGSHFGLPNHLRIAIRNEEENKEFREIVKKIF